MSDIEVLFEQIKERIDKSEGYTTAELLLWGVYSELVVARRERTKTVTVEPRRPGRPRKEAN